MTNPFQIQQIASDIRIGYLGQSYAEDELREAIWLVTLELRNGLPKRERIEAKRQIAQFETLLAALREVSSRPSRG